MYKSFIFNCLIPLNRNSQKSFVHFKGIQLSQWVFCILIFLLPTNSVGNSGERGKCIMSMLCNEVVLWWLCCLQNPLQCWNEIWWCISTARFSLGAKWCCSVTSCKRYKVEGYVYIIGHLGNGSWNKILNSKLQEPLSSMLCCAAEIRWHWFYCFLKHCSCSVSCCCSAMATHMFSL